MGDLNEESEQFESIVGKYGLGEKNDRSDRLIEFFQQNKLAIANTLFQHPNCRLYTWKSPGGSKKPNWLHNGKPEIWKQHKKC